MDHPVRCVLDPGIDKRDPRWIGAWWLGFVICAVGFAVTSLPVLLFPSKLTHADDSTTADSDKNALTNLKGIYQSFCVYLSKRVHTSTKCFRQTLLSYIRLMSSQVRLLVVCSSKKLESLSYSVLRYSALMAVDNVAACAHMIVLPMTIGPRKFLKARNVHFKAKIRNLDGRCEEKFWEN